MGVSFLLLVLLTGFSGHRVAHAELFKYVDDSGKTHFVDSLEKVPEQYRTEVKDESSFPPVNKIKPIASPEERPLNPARVVSNKKVEILVADWCPHCRNLEKFLNDKGIRHKRLDIEDGGKGTRIYRELGSGGIPITRIGEKVIRGYAPDAILETLKQQ